MGRLQLTGNRGGAGLQIANQLGHSGGLTVGGNLAFRVGRGNDVDSGAWLDTTVGHTVRLSLVYLDSGTEDITASWYNTSAALQSTTLATKANGGTYKIARATLTNLRTGWGYFPDYGGADLLLTSTGVLRVPFLSLRDTTRNMRALWTDPDLAEAVLDAPYLDDFTNATHTHADNAQGGSLATTQLCKVATVASVDMKTAGSTTLYTVPTGKTFIPVMVVIRNNSASLAGGTSYSFTNFMQAVDLSSMTTATTSYWPLVAPNSNFTVCASGTTFQITVTTGSTAACTATIDVFGYLV